MFFFKLLNLLSYFFIVNLRTEHSLPVLIQFCIIYSIPEGLHPPPGSIIVKPNPAAWLNPNPPRSSELYIFYSRIGPSLAPPLSLYRAPPDII